MKSFARSSIATLTWAVTVGWAGSSRAGFDYCAPPIIPSCIAEAERSHSHKDMQACSRNVLRFTQTLGAYRACLNRESERAVGLGNDAIARFRCLSQGQAPCATVRDETEQ